ncbi:MAG: zinc-finger-containing protein [Proteobacteria bacterium]|jgi:hypothetical protein|nr:zinc-finger-containing protein [Pseudomonadota bacterium]
MKKIYCAGCEKFVRPSETTGEEIYPHREDLYEKKFLKCDTCGNYKAFDGEKYPTLIPTPELRRARMAIHEILDPLWKEKKIKRGQAYAFISHRIGRTFHNETIRTIDEAREAYEIVLRLKDNIDHGDRGRKNGN